MCCNSSLGLATKVRVCKGAGQEGSMGITSHAPESVGESEGMNTHTSSELPFWELESRWTTKCLEGNCKDKNPLN
jgi:hypothetical protein